jgi:hypothetical protein
MVILSGVSADDKSTVIEQLKRRNYKTETTLAHEMTHALQDQNFGLAKVEGISDNTDRLTVMKSVIEGDATVTGFIYGLQNGNFDENGINIDFGNRPGEIPWQAIERVSSRMPFQYSAGAHFVAEAYKRHGWAGINRLFSNPPVSSQQIAYPQYYFDSPRMPLQIRIKGYERELQGWTPVANDTLGVLLIAGAFARGTVWSERVEGPLRHWSGDRLLVLRKQNDLFLVWMVAFDNPVDAATFASIYSQALDKAPRAPDKATQVSDKALKAPRLLARHGKMVLVLIGANSSSSALSSALWSQTTVEPDAPSAERSARADLNG